MLYQAFVEPEPTPVVYRVISFGPLSAVGAGAGPSPDLVIDPRSEAAVRLLFEAGIQRYDDQGLSEVIETVRASVEETVFAGADAAEAAVAATEVARAAPIVQQSLEEVQLCRGDCDGDDVVSLDELIVAVNVALGNLRISRCGPSDTNGDDGITIDELVQAVAVALSGCRTPPAPS